MNESALPSAIAAGVAFLLGALTSDDVNAYLGVGVATTGLFVGFARYAATLRGAKRAQVEKATATGFFVGVVTAGAVIAILLLT